MSKKIFYAAFSVMGVRLGVYAWVAWIEAFSLTWPYAFSQEAPWYVNVAWPLLFYSPFVLAVVMVVLGFLGGCKYVAGWSWWDVLVMLAIEVMCAMLPLKFFEWHYELVRFFCNMIPGGKF